MTDPFELFEGAARVGEPPLPGDVAARLRARRRRRRQRRLGFAAAPLAAGATAAAVLVPGLLAGADRVDQVAEDPGPVLVEASCDYRPADGESVEPVAPPPAQVSVPETATATLVLSDGPVVLELTGGRTPCTVASFLHLARTGYFDATTCHRVTTSGIFVVQCGDPSAMGGGGPGYQFDDEDLASAAYPVGTLAMANAGPGTNGSQFFLSYGDNDSLPPNYTVFGRVTSGLEVLQAIGARGSDGRNGIGDGRPVEPVTVATVDGP